MNSATGWWPFFRKFSQHRLLLVFNGKRDSISWPKQPARQLQNKSSTQDQLNKPYLYLNFYKQCGKTALRSACNNFFINCLPSWTSTSCLREEFDVWTCLSHRKLFQVKASHCAKVHSIPRLIPRNSPYQETAYKHTCIHKVLTHTAAGQVYI